MKQMDPSLDIGDIGLEVIEKLLSKFQEERSESTTIFETRDSPEIGINNVISDQFMENIGPTFGYVLNEQKSV